MKNIYDATPEEQFHKECEVVNLNVGLFAVDEQGWMKYPENGEYIRTTEQNYNMIDGRRIIWSSRKRSTRRKKRDLCLADSRKIRSFCL